MSSIIPLGWSNPFSGVPSNLGKVSHPKTYTSSLLFLTLSSESPLLTSRTSSPTSFLPAHSDLSPVAPIGSTLPPKSPSFLGLNALLLDSCMSYLGLLCLLLTTYNCYLLTFYFFFYILLFSIYHYLRSNFNLCIQFTRISNYFPTIIYLALFGILCIYDKYRWNKMPYQKNWLGARRLFQVWD